VREDGVFRDDDFFQEQNGNRRGAGDDRGGDAENVVVPRDAFAALQQVRTSGMLYVCTVACLRTVAYALSSTVSGSDEGEKTGPKKLPMLKKESQSHVHTNCGGMTHLAKNCSGRLRRSNVRVISSNRAAVVVSTSFKT